MTPDLFSLFNISEPADTTEHTFSLSLSTGGPAEQVVLQILSEFYYWIVADLDFHTAVLSENHSTCCSISALQRFHFKYL